MDENKVVMKIDEENQTVEVVAPTKLKFKDKVKNFWAKNKKKIIIGGIAAIGIAGGAIATEKILEKRAQEVDEPDPDAESWLGNAMALEAHVEEPEVTPVIETTVVE